MKRKKGERLSSSFCHKPRRRLVGRPVEAAPCRSQVLALRRRRIITIVHRGSVDGCLHFPHTRSLRAVVEINLSGSLPCFVITSIINYTGRIVIGASYARSRITDCRPVSFVCRRVGVFHCPCIHEIDPGSCGNTTIWNNFSGLIKKVKKTG